MSNTNRRDNRGQRNKQDELERAHAAAESNPVIAQFLQYSTEIDEKHDRYERILKIGRDITIESKRIIFLLHTIDKKKANQQKVIAEAGKRLSTLVSNHFKLISIELANRDQYQYVKAYSAGLQEFVEAHSFHRYAKGESFSDWEGIQTEIRGDTKEDESLDEDEKENTDVKIIPPCLVLPTEFMLGLSDVGGEIMRQCINSLGSADIDNCFKSCRALQMLYSGFMGLSLIRLREVTRKIVTLRQSVLKAENVCYNVRVRGGEAAKYGALLVSTAAEGNKNDFENDEGFF